MHNVKAFRMEWTGKLPKERAFCFEEEESKNFTVATKFM